jgi:signal transduction histidine kinase/ActR/RegA family two-component response regulator
VYRGRLLGVISLTNREASRPFTGQHRALLRLLAIQAAIAIENARLFQAQQRACEEMQRAQEELVRTEKLRALGQMSAGIAHDLNNMLSVILGQAELMMLQPVSQEVREGLRILEMAAGDGTQVVRRLQDFARQRPSSRLEPTSLAALVCEALEVTRPRWQDEPRGLGKVIEVEAQLPDLPPILGHASEVREVLTNLILNAVDAMPQGGTLAFRGTATADTVTLSVTDSGIGMSEETRRRVFEPFFTTKGAEGTGLGLSLAYGIMARHGGRIEVTSTPGRGTTFTLWFQAAPGEQGRGVSALTPSSIRPRRILLIDDEAPVRHTVGDLLRSAGHTVTEAESGIAGLARLAQGPVDCVVTDLGMPEMTGWEVATAIKARAPQLPVLLLTGWADPPAREYAPPGTVDRILIKPAQLSTLLAAIEALTTAQGAAP